MNEVDSIRLEQFRQLKKDMVRTSRQQGHWAYCSHSICLFASIGQARGFLHFSLGKRAKSESVEANSQPCSMARAAICASVTRLATA